MNWTKIHRTGPMEQLFIGQTAKCKIDVFLYIYRLDNEYNKPAYRLSVLTPFGMVDFGGWHFKTIEKAKKWVRDNPAIIANIMSWCNKFVDINNMISERNRLNKL